MKRIKILGLILLSVILCFALTACADKLVGITLNTENVQKEFTVGDKFNYDGLIVTAQYGKGSPQDVTDYSVSTPDMTTKGQKTVTVTYQEQTATYQIEVKEAQQQPPQRELQSITIDAEHVQKEFTVGDEFNYDGLVVTAHYNVAPLTEEITTGFTVTGYDMNVADTYTITVDYQGKTATYQIEVKEAQQQPPQRELQSITIDAEHVQKEFTVGDEFNYDGLVVTAHYNVAPLIEEITTGFTVTGYDMNVADTYTVTVDYQGKTATYQIEVKEAQQLPPQRELQSITIDAEHVQKEFTVGDEFNYDGLVVTAHYNVAPLTEEITTGFTVTGYDMNVADTYTVTVDYQGKTATYQIEVKEAQQQPPIEEPELERIEVNADAATKEYFVGDTFSYEGIVVTAYYDDGSHEVIETGYDVDDPDMTTAGLKTITVTYQGKQDHYEINVEERPITDGPTDFVSGTKSYTASLADVSNCQKQAHADGTDGNIIAALGSESVFTFTVNSYFEGTVEFFVAAAGQGDWGAPVTDALALYVNGSDTPVNITVSTGGWTNFTEIFLGYFDLVKGENTFEFHGVNANGNVNVDRIVIHEKGAYVGVAHKYGAASATKENCSFEANGAGLDGNIFGGMNGNSVITYTIKATDEQAVELRVSVAGGKDGNEWTNWNPTAAQEEAFELFVNGTSLGKFDVGPSGWTDFKEIKVGYAQLHEGENVIEIKAVNANYNFNYLFIAPVLSYSGSAMQVGASNATLQGGCNLQNGAGLDGTFIGGIGTTSTITFTVFSDVDEALVNIALFVAGQGEFLFEVVVNGETLGAVSATTGDWLNFGEKAAGTATLKEGANIIEIRTSTGGFNFSCLAISPAVGTAD